jgi:hypothetical protein
MRSVLVLGVNVKGWGPLPGESRGLNLQSTTTGRSRAIAGDHGVVRIFQVVLSR